MGTTVQLKEVERKFAALSDAARQEVLDFIDFLGTRHSKVLEGPGSTDDVSFWHSVGEIALERIWDNPEDDIYAELLDS